MNDSLKDLIDRANAEALESIAPSPFEKYRPAVEAEVQLRYGVGWDEIVGEHRRQDIVRARHFALVALSFLTGYGDSALARLVGVDRCRIIFARKKLASYFVIYDDERMEYAAFLNAVRRMAGDVDV